MSIANEISRLQTAKAGLKTAIEGKGISVPSNATLDAYPALVSSISSSGVANSLKYARDIKSLFYCSTFNSTNVTVDFDGAVISPSEDFSAPSAQSCFSQINAVNLVIQNLTIDDADASYFLSQKNTYVAPLKTVTFSNCTIAPSKVTNFARYAANLESITGEIDMSNVTTMTGMFQSCSSLTSVRFKANTLGISTEGLNQSPFDDATLVNIANSLNSNVTGKTITFSSSCRTRCTTLMGNNNNGTFVASDEGAMTLGSFITNVKGWNLSL